MGFFGFIYKAIGAYNAVVAFSMEESIYGTMRGLLLDSPNATARVGEEARPEAQEQPSTAFQWLEPVRGTVVPGRSESIGVTLDAATLSSHFVLYSDGNITMRLRTPAGDWIDSSREGYEYKIDGGVSSYSVATSSTGTWTVELTAGEGVDYDAEYALVVFAETRAFVGIGLNQQRYEPGETMYIYAYAEDAGAALSGADITAPTTDDVVITVTDGTLPAVSFRPPTPEDGSEVGRFHVVALAQDDWLTRVEIIFDGVMTEMCDAAGLQEVFCVWRPENGEIQEGVHTIEALAVDTSGNRGSAQRTFAVVDIVPPTPAPTAAPSHEDSGGALGCRDGIDNDGDGLTDCADPDCGNTPPCEVVAPLLSPTMLGALILTLSAVGLLGLRGVRRNREVKQCVNRFLNGC